MIPDNIIEQIGRTNKPHGINGEISAVVDPDINLDELSCLIMKIDGINVPFFLESWRRRGSESVLLKFDHVSNEIQAEAFCGKELYVLMPELPDNRFDGSFDDDDSEGMYISDMIGWTLYNDKHLIGRITDFDDSTENLLLTVAPAEEGRKDILIPLADGLIDRFDPDNNVIYMNLPEGIIDL